MKTLSALLQKLHRSKYAILTLVLLLAGCGEEARRSFITGTVAKPFDLATLAGDRVSLASLKGKFVVIHFAATWCPFCNAEAPNLEALGQKYKSRNVEVLWINIKEDKEIVAQWVAARNITFPVLVDTDGRVAILWPGRQDC